MATDAGIGGVVATQESVSAVFVLEVGEVNDVPEAPAVALAKQDGVMEDVRPERYAMSLMRLRTRRPLLLTYTFSVVRVEQVGSADVKTDGVSHVDRLRR